MQSRNPESQKDTSSKQSLKQGQSTSELGHLGKLLGFEEQQMQALAYVAGWESESLKLYLRAGILCILQTSMDEMRSSGDEPEASALLSAVEPLFSEALKDGITIGSKRGEKSEALAPEAELMKKVLGPNADADLTATPSSLFPETRSDWRRCLACARGHN